MNGFVRVCSNKLMIHLQRVPKNVSWSVSNSNMLSLSFNIIFADTASVEAYMDRQRRVQDKGKDLIAQMQSVSEAMKANSDKLAGTLVQEVHRQFTVSFNKYVLQNRFFCSSYLFCFCFGCTSVFFLSSTNVVKIKHFIL